MRTVAEIAGLALAVCWAWRYADGKKRKERARKRREEGDRIMARILGLK